MAASAAIVAAPYVNFSLADPLQTAAGNQILRIVLLLFLLLQMLQWSYLRLRAESALAGIFCTVLLIEVLAMIPIFARTPDSPATLRVLTYNSQSQGEFAWLSWISSDSVDIACIEEMPGRNLEKIRGNAARRGFIWQTYQFGQDSTEGVALLSRLPFVAVDSLIVPGRGERERAFPVARVLVGQDTVTVIGVHLSSSPRWNSLAETGTLWSRRELQVEAVLARVEESDEPAIVLGDCNSTPTDRLMRLMRRDLTDMRLHGGTGIGATWPAELPFLCIDQVFARGFDGSSEIRREALATSDHLALSMTLHRTSPAK